MENLKSKLTNKVNNLRDKFKAQNAFYPAGEYLDGIRFRNTERIVSRILSGDVCQLGQKFPTVQEIEADLEAWANRGLEDAAYGDYYYTYEKQW